MAVPPNLSPRRERRRCWVVPLVLALLSACLWCVQNRRLDADAWSHPLTYTGDTMEILVRLKAVSEGELLPFFPQTLERLGAPFGANWNDYPVADKLLFFVFGNVARLTGVSVASNLAVMMAVVTAALTFYGTARFLRVRRLWSFSAALLFAFTYQATARGLPHLWLAYSYTVPLVLLTSWLLAASSRLRWKSTAGLFCLGTAVLVGASNPYNLFLFLQLVALAFAANVLNPRGRTRLAFTAACALTAVASWALFQCESWLYSSGEQTAPLIVRNYAGTELYALKPVELFVPPTNHHSALFASLSHRYLRWAAFKGETSYSYLGLIGIAGLLWIVIDLARRLSARNRHRIPAYGLQAGWILLYSVPGGINSLLALFFGLQIFRATNRYSIFLSALALLFLAAQASRLSRTWSRIAQGAVALPIVLLGLWDQIPTRVDPGYFACMRQMQEADVALGHAMQAALPARTAVFQLPTEKFPESPPTNGMPEYEHFRPFLETRDLRFSYGALKGRADSQWQLDFEKLAPNAWVPALEKAGFGAICLDRRGYPDRGEAVLAIFRQANRQVVCEAEEFVVVRLQASPNPQPPLATQPTFGSGWYNTEESERWAYEDATWSFYNPYFHPMSLTVQFDLHSADSRNFIFELNGTKVARQPIGPEPGHFNLASLTLRPGVNRFDLRSDKPPVRVNEARYGLHAFSVKNIVLTLQSTGPVSP